MKGLGTMVKLLKRFWGICTMVAVENRLATFRSPVGKHASTF